jgi:hypothetical protein
MSQISLTVVQSGTKLLDTPSVLSLNSFWFNLLTADTTVSGANSKIEYHRSGPAGGSYFVYYVSETVTEIEALVNGASPALTNRVAVSIPATATMAEGDLAKGYVVTTSAAATTITTRTFAQISAELGAEAGATYDWVLNNVGGANTVTITPGANITAASALTGGTDMTVASTELAVFRITFAASSATIARLV